MKCRACEMLKEEKNTIYENDGFFAVTPDVISQKYQIMIFPKKHIESIFDMSDNELEEFFMTTIRVAEHMKKILKPVAYRLKINEKLFELKPTPHHIKHRHFQIIPRFKGQNPEPDYDDRKWLLKTGIWEIVETLRM